MRHMHHHGNFFAHGTWRASRHWFEVTIREKIKENRDTAMNRNCLPHVFASTGGAFRGTLAKHLLRALSINHACADALHRYWLSTVALAKRRASP